LNIINSLNLSNEVIIHITFTWHNSIENILSKSINTSTFIQIQSRIRRTSTYTQKRQGCIISCSIIRRSSCEVTLALSIPNINIRIRRTTSIGGNTFNFSWGNSESSGTIAWKYEFITNRRNILKSDWSYKSRVAKTRRVLAIRVRMRSILS